MKGRQFIGVAADSRWSRTFYKRYRGTFGFCQNWYNVVPSEKVRFSQDRIKRFLNIFLSNRLNVLPKRPQTFLFGNSNIYIQRARARVCALISYEQSVATKSSYSYFIRNAFIYKRCARKGERRQAIRGRQIEKVCPCPLIQKRCDAPPPPFHVKTASAQEACLSNKITYEIIVSFSEWVYHQ